MTAVELTCRLIEHALGELAERLALMPEAEFLDQHAAIHAQPPSSTADLVRAIFERENWRRWPEGRGVQECPAA